ncbi:nidogen-1 [Thalassophryne amazonica]|uniref:nidogen-1 n=1 Tax=Thalassophryne amazonica TaxID=390379 RepID=UPI0014720595|nr:nidogen-1 [Thalassophryne amazonica]
MGWQERGWLVCATFVAFVSSAQSITRELLFPFDQSAGDQLLEAGTDLTHPLDLDKPVFFYDGTFDSIFINTNGFVAMTEPSSEETYLGKMPPKFGMIAALQGDLDTSDGVGRVSFRQDSSPDILRLAAEHINRAFPAGDEVDPTHAVVITWANIARHEPESNSTAETRNTFQLVIASLETASYAIFLYTRDGIQYSSTPAGDSSVTMHAGLSKGEVRGFLWSTQGPYYRMTTDDEASVQALSEETNSGKHGVWVYEIGTSPHFTNVAPGEVTDVPPEDSQQGGPEGDVEVPETTPGHPGEQQVEYLPYEPEGQILVHPVQFQPQHVDFQPVNPEVVVVEDGDINVDVFSYNLGTCTNNRHKCSPFSDCKDYSGGYCCHCRPGFYGNGIQCVAEGKPQRMNGKVYGKVYVGNSPSPQEFTGNDLHSYVVVNDGRSYVAISDIPSDIGHSLQPLATLGGAIGWSFALEKPGFKNGFSLIGGEFTRQVEVIFLPGNEKLTIRQEFKGIDEHDHLVVNTMLDGRIPEVPRDSVVQIGPYSEIYQYSSNLITSSSTRDYIVIPPNGSPEPRTYQWRQTITFQSCQYDDSPRDMRPTQLLSVDQVFVLYDVNNQLIRFAMSNKIGDINGGQPEENPCFTGRHGCDTNAVCRPEHGTQFTCECAAGFNGDGRACYDIDECRETPHICGPHAICNNQPGTFRCECEDGYQFSSDGRTCIQVNQPVDHCAAGTHSCDIPERAQCSYTGGSTYICSCLPGFIGDGRSCQDVDECQPGRCHQDAVCYNTQGSFTCQCRPGYYGDGFYCSSERTKTQCERHRDSLLEATEFGPRGPRPPVGHFVPTCDENGAYEPMQCHGSTGQCWCVDRNGQEIPGTRSGPGSVPMCIDHGVVPPHVGPTPRPDVQPLPPGTHLLFTQSGRIDHVPLDGQDMKKDDAKAVLHLPEKVIIGVAYDCVEKMVYWTEITSPSISKANIHGGEPILVIRSDLDSPEGIAIDHLGRTMFWTDSVKDHIEVASLDGSQRRVIVDSDLVNPRAIIADPPSGNLYWADWNRDAPKIETSYMDGSNRRVLVKEDLGLPNGLTYDPQSFLLCWADAGTHKMECMNPSQGDRRMVLEGIQYPFGITAFGKNLYYTDWKRDAVVAVDRFAGRESDAFKPQKRTKLYGITTAYTQCPSGQNYCAVNNGGCSHLCLATPTGRSCKCPDKATSRSCVERDSSY